MKTFILLCTFATAALAAPADTYNPAYDNFDANELVENLRLLKNYGKCFLGQGPCTPEGADFKKTIPDALKTSCAKCTPKQKELVRTVIHGFQEKLPDLWEELVEKEDPTGQYKEEFDRFLSASDKIGYEMKAVVILATLSLAASAYAYSTAHDDLDVGAIVQDKDQLQSFLDCFTGKKPCNKLTQDFKDNLPEVIREACAKCNSTQKQKLKLFLAGLNEKLPGEYAEFKKMFDPEGKLFDALDAALAKS
ncbi:uncharacterized protein [Battus philenor]|uniref:uncharacterized protein n=1 Tax=Battus philenor TaxID=42288 RepID=UPI0035CECB9E